MRDTTLDVGGGHVGRGDAVDVRRAADVRCRRLALEPGGAVGVLLVERLVLEQLAREGLEAMPVLLELLDRRRYEVNLVKEKPERYRAASRRKIVE